MDENENNLVERAALILATFGAVGIMTFMVACVVQFVKSGDIILLVMKVVLLILF